MKRFSILLLFALAMTCHGAETVWLSAETPAGGILQRPLPGISRDAVFVKGGNANGYSISVAIGDSNPIKAEQPSDTEWNITHAQLVGAKFGTGPIVLELRSSKRWGLFKSGGTTNRVTVLVGDVWRVGANSALLPPERVNKPLTNVMFRFKNRRTPETWLSFERAKLLLPNVTAYFADELSDENVPLGIIVNDSFLVKETGKPDHHAAELAAKAYSRAHADWTNAMADWVRSARSAKTGGRPQGLPPPVEPRNAAFCVVGEAVRGVVGFP